MEISTDLLTEMYATIQNMITDIGFWTSIVPHSMNQLTVLIVPNGKDQFNIQPEITFVTTEKSIKLPLPTFVKTQIGQQPLGLKSKNVNQLTQKIHLPQLDAKKL
jgi:hypothetical protein